MQSYNAAFVYISSPSHPDYIILLDSPPKQWLDLSSLCLDPSSSWLSVREESQGLVIVWI